MIARGSMAAGWTAAESTRCAGKLLAMNYDERAANACIGRDRADLVLAGCAILEEIRAALPARACALPTAACAKAFSRC